MEIYRYMAMDIEIRGDPNAKPCIMVVMSPPNSRKLGKRVMAKRERERER